jgi:hemerythrin-like domain-containing protein
MCKPVVAPDTAGTQAQDRAAAMTSPCSPSSTITQRPARYDLYSAIHRALRLLMTDTLARLGRLDVNDRHELTGALQQLEATLRLSRNHLAHENQFVHAAIEAREPGATQAIGSEHQEQLDTIAALQAEAAALGQVPTTPAALRLYRHLGRYVSDAFEHMHAEETQLNPILWAHYGDDQILAIEHEATDAATPEDRALILRWMTLAITPIERAWRYSLLQRKLGAEDYEHALAIAQEVLDARSWNKLRWALGMTAAA